MTDLQHCEPEGRRAVPAMVCFDEPVATEPAVAGRKAATLAGLAGGEFPVVPGVVITTVGSGSSRAPAGSADPLPDLRSRIVDLFGTGLVAVRSSSPAEDGALTSAAGQYLTVLRVPPREPDLSEAVRRVRRSAGEAPMAVLIQPMIEARAAGVAFGADPVTGDGDAVHISAVRGLADRLVAGSAEADQWTVTGAEARCAHAAAGSITAGQAVEIARLVAALGARLGGPQDVEWAIDDAGLHLLQSRPITALPTPPPIDLPPGTWVNDPNRYPDGMTPFGMSVAAPEVSRGLTGVFTRCGALVERVELRGIAGRPYLRFVPVGGRDGPPPPGPILGVLSRMIPAMRTRCRRARSLLASGALDADIEQWTTSGRDEARHAADELLAVDVTGLTDASLADHLERIREQVRRGLAIHFHLMAPYLVGVYGLVQACEQILGWSQAETMGLLAGLSPASDEPTRALVTIAARIADHPVARQAVLGESSGDAAGDQDDDRGSGAGPTGSTLVMRLRRAAPDLADQFDTWCRTYGMRTGNDDPGSPTLLEIPGLLTGLLADRVRVLVESGDTAGQAVRTGAEERLARARAELSTRRTADRQRFEDALATAKTAYPIREDNVLWALAVPSGLARHTAMEIGSRLHRRGEIDDVRDVVMLEIETVLRAARGETAPGALRPAIARAKAERAWVATHPLPGFFGPPPSPMPDLRWLPRAARVVNEALQLDRPDPAETGPARPGALLTGVAGSPGSYTGPAHIVRGPDDFATLRRGAVLVCAVTDPAWSVLFSVAGAVVTDGGGVLTHSAIIAREHGIPAVLGTGSATRDLVDGQVVTVDGTTGTVLPGPGTHP